MSTSIRSASSFSSADETNPTLTGLLQTQWQVYHASLMLDTPRRKLKSKIEAVTRMITQGTKNKNQPLKMTFTNCPDIRRDDSLPEALLIQVFLGQKLEYTGYFLNWSDTREQYDEMEALPILLMQAKSEMTGIVHDALVKVFDFNLTPIAFNTVQLAQMLTMFIHFADPEDSKGSAVLKFTVPGLSPENMITASVDAKTLINILELYTKENLENPLDEPIYTYFYEKMLVHFFRAYQLKLDRADLRQVSVPENLATSCGQIRVNDEELLSSALVGIDGSFLKRRRLSPRSSPARSESDM